MLLKTISHQDYNNSQELSREEYLNVLMDPMANSFCQECQEQDSLHQANDLSLTRKCSTR